MKNTACSILSFAQLQTSHDTLILMTLFLVYNLGAMGLGISLLLAALYFLWTPAQGIKAIINNLILHSATPAQLLSINYQVRNGGYTEAQLSEKLELAKALTKEICAKNEIELPMVFCSYWINPSLASEQKPYAVSVNLSFLKKIIIVNPEALLQLTEAELKGVLAHELSHVKHTDSNKFLALDFFRGAATAIATFGFVRLFCSKTVNFSLWPFGLTQISSAPLSYKLMFQELVAVWFCAKVLSYLLMLVQNAIKRNIENRCDLEAAQTCGQASGLLGFLEKSLLIIGDCHEWEASHPAHFTRINTLKLWETENSKHAAPQITTATEQPTETQNSETIEPQEDAANLEMAPEQDETTKVEAPKKKSKKSDETSL